MQNIIKFIVLIILFLNNMQANFIEEKNSINLTKEEKLWIQNNKVSIGIEQWEPMINFDKDSNKASGLAGDILNVVIKRLNLKTDLVLNTWDILLDDFKKHKIDLLPATYYTAKRATYGLYSKGYVKTKEYIYTKNNNSYVVDFESLKGKKVAIIKDYGTIPKIKEKYPSIQIVETKNLEDSITRVLNDEVDALVEIQLSVEHYIRDNLIVGIKAVAQSDFESSTLHYFINTKKPILQSILQKGLDSITVKEKNDLIF